MNMLIDDLPKSVNINGVEYPINTDFRAGIRYEILMQETMDEVELVLRSLELFYKDSVPEDLNAAIEQIIWFYQCGKQEKPSGAGKSLTNGKQAYSFACDDDLIYAAILDQYGIDLQEVEYMHWWKFQALFKGLRDGNRVTEVMGYRVTKLENMPKDQKNFYTAMQQRYRIPESKKVQEKEKELAEILMSGGDPSQILKGE